MIHTELYGTNKKVSTMKKESSTNSINRNYLNENCGIAYTQSVIGGRWKLNILGFLLSGEKLRYSELRAKLVGISERMLISQLKELEKDGLVNRIVHPQVPPKVEYELTEVGQSLKTILDLMSDWGEINREK